QVDAVLEGSIHKTGDSLRLTAQLVRVADGARIWEIKAAEESADLLAIEQTIPEQVARALKLNLTTEEQAALAKRPTKSLEAYQHYLKGQHFGNQMLVRQVAQ